jgi:hypothetical protein
MDNLLSTKTWTGIPVASRHLEDSFRVLDTKGLEDTRYCRSTNKYLKVPAATVHPPFRRLRCIKERQHVGPHAFDQDNDPNGSKKKQAGRKANGSQ